MNLVTSDIRASFCWLYARYKNWELIDCDRLLSLADARRIPASVAGTYEYRLIVYFVKMIIPL